MNVAPLNHRVSTAAIPHAEVWTPTRPMIHDTLPLPATDPGSLRKLLLTGQRRRETAAMRQVWRVKRNKTAVSCSSVLGQYKHMLLAREEVKQPHSQVSSKKEEVNNEVKKDHGGCSDMPTLAGKVPTLKGNCDKSPLSAQSCKQLPKYYKDATHSNRKFVSSYRDDYIQKIGLVSLPKVPIQTLSADWWNEIQKKPVDRIAYTEPVNVITNRKKIKREIVGRFFIKSSTQTYFQVTVPKHLHTYNIHPEFDSEYQRCWID
ncbi:hypothetical protein EB796_021082 [Bugula neritina]|uniref:Uncharacterized protein n=1 Tax=Bugula neritina TaxID=10212 RepID=A0A7J7J345_BUGNE|nr:hypothetical protein EB796_021082 [Bugula neritina]